jgi:site-specific recombinase XerD
MKAKNIELFKKYLKERDLSDRTIKNYLSDILHFRKWLTDLYQEERDLESAEQDDIKAYRQELLNIKRQKATSINRRLQSIKIYFKFVNTISNLTSDPAQKIRFVRRGKPTKPQSINRTEAHLLLNAAKQSKYGLAKRNYALIQLMLQAGLRVGEICRLQIRDIKINERSGSVRVIDSKGIKEREVPLNASVRNALKEYLEEKKEAKETDCLFANKRKEGIAVRSLQLVIDTLYKRSKIERIKVSAHTLRHTFAINYLHSNPSQLSELALLMGHDSINTTLIYTKASKEKLGLAVEKTEVNIYG